jgi:hypothetical protein
MKQHRLHSYMPFYVLYFVTSQLPIANALKLELIIVLLTDPLLPTDNGVRKLLRPSLYNRDDPLYSGV